MAGYMSSRLSCCGVSYPIRPNPQNFRQLQRAGLLAPYLQEAILGDCSPIPAAPRNSGKSWSGRSICILPHWWVPGRFLLPNDEHMLGFPVDWPRTDRSCCNLLFRPFCTPFNDGPVLPYLQVRDLYQQLLEQNFVCNRAKDGEIIGST